MRSENLLKRIIAVQQIVLSYRRKGVSQKWVYENVIEPDPNIFISKTTFNRYMCINARKELKQLKVGASNLSNDD